MKKMNFWINRFGSVRFGSVLEASVSVRFGLAPFKNWNWSHLCHITLFLFFYKIVFQQWNSVVSIQCFFLEFHGYREISVITIIICIFFGPNPQICQCLKEMQKWYSIAMNMLLNVTLLCSKGFSKISGTFISNF